MAALNYAKPCRHSACLGERRLSTIKPKIWRGVYTRSLVLANNTGHQFEKAAPRLHFAIPIDDRFWNDMMLCQLLVAFVVASTALAAPAVENAARCANPLLRKEWYDHVVRMGSPSDHRRN